MKPSEKQTSNLPQIDQSEYCLGLRYEQVLQDTYKEESQLTLQERWELWPTIWMRAHYSSRLAWTEAEDSFFNGVGS